jgi:hypothetical protein
MRSSDYGYRHDERERRVRPGCSHHVDRHYEFLGLPRNSSQDTVKRRFLQLALRHHPDTNSDKDRSPDRFVKIREAFEGIRKHLAGERFEGETMSWFTEEEFDAWFYEETGQRMDSAMRREVMNVYRSGLTRTEYGAVWEIAFILEEEGFFAKKETVLPKQASASHRDRMNVRRKRSNK